MQSTYLKVIWKLISYWMVRTLFFESSNLIGPYFLAKPVPVFASIPRYNWKYYFFFIFPNCTYLLSFFINMDTWRYSYLLWGDSGQLSWSSSARYDQWTSFCSQVSDPDLDLGLGSQIRFTQNKIESVYFNQIRSSLFRILSRFHKFRSIYF